MAADPVVIHKLIADMMRGFGDAYAITVTPDGVACVSPDGKHLLIQAVEVEFVRALRKRDEGF